MVRTVTSVNPASSLIRTVSVLTVTLRHSQTLVAANSPAEEATAMVKHTTGQRADATARALPASGPTYPRDLAARVLGACHGSACMPGEARSVGVGIAAQGAATNAASEPRRCVLRPAYGGTHCRSREPFPPPIGSTGLTSHQELPPN